MAEPVDPIVSRIRAGDRHALTELLALRRPQLLAFIARSMSDALRARLEPQDILQEVSLSALNSLPELAASDRDPFRWLCRLAERRIIDAHRKLIGSKKRSSRREVPLQHAADQTGAGEFIDLLVASITSPSQAFSRQHRELQLQQAFEQLPLDCREALRLRYVEGLPSKAIAARLGKSDGAVRVMLTRSVNRLRAILGADGDGVRG